MTVSSEESPQPASAAVAAPTRRLSLFDSISIIVGIMIGSSIFTSLPLIAWNLVGPSHDAYSFYVVSTNNRRSLTYDEARNAVNVINQGVEYELVSGAGLRFSWALGGVLAMIGALCLAELATAYPQEGGIYVYLSRAFGRRVGLAYVWLEFLLIRPGNLGVVAFGAAVYLQKLLPLPDDYFISAPSWWALVLVAGVTGINLLGFTLEKWMQNGLTLAKILGLAAVVLIAYRWPIPPGYRPPNSPDWQAGGTQSFAVAMTLIMFAYGGWSDVVYVASEVREPKKNLFRALFLGVAAVTAIYLIVVDSFLFALPFRGIRNGEAVAAEMIAAHFGEGQERFKIIGSRWISALIVVSCFGSIHGMLFTSSRAFFAAGREHQLVAWFGKWSQRFGMPLRAVLAQGLLTLALLVIFGKEKSSFEQLVNFTGPFFYGFLLLVAISLVVLRYRDKPSERTYQVPFYPLTPLVFGLTSLWLCYGTTRYLIGNLQGWQWVWTAAVVLSAVMALVVDRPKLEGGPRGQNHE